MAEAPVRALRRNSARVRAALGACDPSARLSALVRGAGGLRVLGLDVNTSSTGVAVLDARARVLHWGAVRTAQFASADVLSVGAAVDAALAEVRAACEPAASASTGAAEWLVGVEAFLRMFRPGRTHNAGLFQLAQLNGIVSFACWRRFGARPVAAHPTAARAFFGLSSSASGEPIKQQALALAQREQPAAAADALPRAARGGQWAPAAFDAADAYVVANYTRCQHLAARLAQAEPLRAAFAAEYLARLYGGTSGAAERRAVDAMSAAQRDAHLSRLLEPGVRDWLRAEYAAELAPSAWSD